jgi:hypothetical protein
VDWTKQGVQANLRRPVAWQAVRQATAELVQNELRCFLQPAERVKLHSALNNRQQPQSKTLAKNLWQLGDSGKHCLQQNNATSSDGDAG